MSIVNLIVLIVLLLSLYQCDACTNIIVERSASTDSSNIIGYNADSIGLYGSLYHYPAADHAEGAMRDVFNWDNGQYYGAIKEAQHTYNVVGNMNEFGLSIGETTFGGLSILSTQSKAKIDYGSLIWITLQRAKSAREAIKVMDQLMSEYGYASGGESFSVIDNNEAFIMEIIGKGEYELGSVWVAVKVPEGHITAHANQARIRNFPLNDPENCLHSKDVISFAKKLGLYSGEDKDFSFSDIYDPITFSGARMCEARVYSIFSSVVGEDFANQYLDYAMGYNLTNRMPLFVKPSSKLSTATVMKLFRSHYEGFPNDMSGNTFADIGATGAYSPYRNHPLSWSSQGSSYFNERPISTQQTGWNFIAQSRAWMPKELSGLLWFGVDDSGTTVRFPIYGSAYRVPEAFAGRGAQDGETTPMTTFDTTKAFTVFNLVANFAYANWNLVYPDVVAKIESLETDYSSRVNDIDSKAIELYNSGTVSDAVDFVTQFSEDLGNTLVKEWYAYFGQLFVKYKDGYVMNKDSNNKQCGCSAANAGYPQPWYDAIATTTGDHYKTPTSLSSEEKIKTIPKEKLLALR